MKNFGFNIFNAIYKLKAKTFYNVYALSKNEIYLFIMIFTESSLQLCNNSVFVGDFLWLFRATVYLYFYVIVNNTYCAFTS